MQEQELKEETWAVLLGRFQNLHVEHTKMVDYIRTCTNCTKILVLLGEQRNSPKDPLNYMHRANIFNRFLEDKFEEHRIVQTFDTNAGDEVWAKEVKNRIIDSLPKGANFCIFVTKKQSDKDESGYHYANSLGNEMLMIELPVVDETVSSSAIRANPVENSWMLADESFLFTDLGIKGSPVDHRILYDTDWMKIKECPPRNGGSYYYASRKNRDSIGFILKHGNMRCFTIEGKPPIGDVRCISAFGGSFDSLQSNPYQILRQEVLEEAGFSEEECGKIRFCGSYMATTQSDEIVHLYEVEVKHMELNPQSTDPGEAGNEPTWLRLEDCWMVDDWKAQMILRSE